MIVRRHMHAHTSPHVAGAVEAPQAESFEAEAVDAQAGSGHAGDDVAHHEPGIPSIEQRSNNNSAQSHAWTALCVHVGMTHRCAYTCCSHRHCCSWGWE